MQSALIIENNHLISHQKYRKNIKIHDFAKIRGTIRRITAPMNKTGPISLNEEKKKINDTFFL